MIDGADFLKWCEIFKVNFGGNGGSVDLQEAYSNGDGSILESSNKPVVFRDIAGTGSNSSLFDIFSITKGTRPFPLMTTVQRDAIVSPANGLAIFNITTGQINYFNSLTASWIAIDAASGAFLEAANNLSDVDDTNQSLINLGIPASSSLSFTDNVILINPPPALVNGSSASPGGFIRLPSAQGINAINIGQFISIKVDQPSESIDIQDSGSNVLFSVNAGITVNVMLDDNATSAGTWIISSLYPSMSLSSILMGSSTNDLIVGSLTAGDGIDIDSSTPSELKLSATTDLQGAYTNGNGTITVLNDNSKPFAVGNDETTIFGDYGVYVSATRNLEAIPTETWFHFFEARNSVGDMVQYGAIAAKAIDLTAGAVGGYMALGAAVADEGGVVLPFFYADGINAQSVSTRPTLISENIVVIDPSSMFDITTNELKGSRPFPLGDTTNRDSIISPATGLHFFNTDTMTANVFDSLTWEIYLTRNKIVAGDNITLDTTDTNGSIIINSSGTGPGSNSDYGSFVVNNSTVSTVLPVTSTYYPISVIAGTFSPLINSNFVSEIKTVSTVATPGFTYVDDATQYFIINFNIFPKGASASDEQYIFQIFIQHADLSIDATGITGFFRAQDIIFTDGASLSGPIQLQTGDFVFLQVQNPLSTAGVTLSYINACIYNVNATSATQMIWEELTTTGGSLAPNMGYTLNSASPITKNMPVSMNYGTSIKINGINSGSFSLTLNVGQSFIYESATGTTSLDFTNSRATVTLRCVVEDTVFQVEETTGGITLT